MNERTMESLYMEWAKTRSTARFNLATSGVVNVPRSEFPLAVEELEITIPKGGYGYAPLLERIARHTGAPVECIVTAIGTSLANHLAMAAVLRPGDEVLIEEPAYGPLLDVAHYLGAKVKRFPRRFENDFAVEPEEVARAITAQTRLVVLTNFHNPSGNLIPTETLRSIGEAAQRVGARVLVDEVYLEMLFDGGAPFAFPLADVADSPFLITSSLTKGYGLSGLRCGWILASAGNGAADLAVARFVWFGGAARNGADVGDGVRSFAAIPRAGRGVGGGESSAVGRLFSMRTRNSNVFARLTARSCFRVCAAATWTRSQNYCARNMRPRWCPDISSRCRSTSGSGSAVRRRRCARDWSD